MTITNGTIQRYLQLLSGYVLQLQKHRERSRDELHADLDLAWAIEHGLQLCIQCVIDICQYTVAELGLSAPESSPQAIELLRDAGVFSADFATTLIQMVRFRNILVHAYAHVDVDRVHSNLAKLDDFAQFAQCILKFFEGQKQDNANSSDVA